MAGDDLFEDAPCGLLSTGPDGTILLVNRTFEQLTGHRREELVGARRFQDLLSGGGRIYHETHYAPLLRMQGAVREIALDLVRADGTRMSALVNSVMEGDTVRTAVFPAADRRSYERELLEARDRERAARRSGEVLQRMSAALAAAPDVEAVAAAVTDALAAGAGAEAVTLAVHDERSERMRVIGGDVGAEEAVTFRVPLRGSGRISGAITLRFGGAGELSRDDRALVEACAAQAGVALDRALLYEEQREVAHALQRSLLAGDPPADPRFAVAALYRPGVDGLEVGGDWHDAFLLPDGRLVVVVGDVVGRGLGAASAMGQLRSAVRALAGAELGPAGVLAELDTFVEGVPSARFATVVYAEVDPATGATRLAAAGHLPPVLVGVDGEPELVRSGGSAPLGVPPAAGPRAETELRVPEGGALLLYTDGLVERRTEPIDAGLDRLTSAVADHAGLAPDALVSALHDALLEDGHTDDDVCCLCFARAGGRARAALAGGDRAVAR